MESKIIDFYFIGESRKRYKFHLSSRMEKLISFSFKLKESIIIVFMNTDLFVVRANKISDIKLSISFSDELKSYKMSKYSVFVEIEYLGNNLLSILKLSYSMSS
jgi:hypothetical protein